MHGRRTTGWPWPPDFLAPFNKLGYICTSDGSIHVNIVVVRAVLALDAILADTKKVWFSGHALTESVVFRTRSQMRKAGRRGLRPKACFCMHDLPRALPILICIYMRALPVLIRKDPFRKALAKKISALRAGGAQHSLDCFASQLYTSAAHFKNTIYAGRNPR